MAATETRVFIGPARISNTVTGFVNTTLLSTRLPKVLNPWKFQPSILNWSWENHVWIDLASQLIDELMKLGYNMENDNIFNPCKFQSSIFYRKNFVSSFLFLTDRQTDWCLYHRVASLLKSSKAPFFQNWFEITKLIERLSVISCIFTKPIHFLPKFSYVS